MVITGTQTAVVEGQDWGPAVTKTVIKLSEKIKAASAKAADFEVAEIKESFDWEAFYQDFKMDESKFSNVESKRMVTDAYTSDENGNKSSDSEYLTLELSYSQTEGGIFCLDLENSYPRLCKVYEFVITLHEDTALENMSGEKVTGLDIDKEVSLNDALYPQLKGVDLSGKFTGSEGHAITYASYEPQNDGKKHPLVIWLHGAGECGVDPRINTLGNKVTPLFGEEFQNALGGAYVLCPQCTTFWMQYNGDGRWNDNKGEDSVYLRDLKELIDTYAAEHEGVDKDRIIVGGCSNGGFMTMDLVMNYPDYFAAAYPICEAYLDSGIRDEQIEGIKNLPIWFIYAENDTTVDPALYEIPTIERLKKIGGNVHTSVFKDVHDTSGKYKDKDGNPYQYMGHFSWVYFFNNKCEENGVNLWKWMSEQHR